LDSTLLIAQDSIVFKPGFHAQAGMHLTAKIDSTIVPVNSTDYIGGIEYRNLPRGMASSPAQGADSTGRGSIQAIYHPEGRAVPSGSNWRHEYVITDHLGNTRLRFSDLDENSQIDTTELLDIIDYYPFGHPWQDAGYRYTYNGKELDRELGLGLHFYGFRLYDPTIGRFSSIDPISEKFSIQSPYAYAANNPVTNIDLLGLAAASTQDLIRDVWTQGTGTYDNDGNRIEEEESKEDENCCPGGIHPLGQLEAAKVVASREGRDLNEIHNEIVSAHLATQDEVAVEALLMISGEWVFAKIGGWLYRAFFVQKAVNNSSRVLMFTLKKLQAKYSTLAILG
jgi:RHS repeat-associated protein